MYFSRKFSFEVIVKISSQSIKICSSHAASQFEKHGEKRVLSDIIFIYKQKFVIYPYSAIFAPYSCPSRLRFSSFFFLDDRWASLVFSVSERSKNLTRHSFDSTQRLTVLTDCQVQHLHNLQYTCTIIVENRNGEVTGSINNSFPLDFDFGATKRVS